MIDLFGKLGVLACGAVAALIIMDFGQTPALAHHAMGYETPATLGDGLLSGLAHPVIGLNHLVFIVAAGLLALLTSYRFLRKLGVLACGAVAAFIVMDFGQTPALAHHAMGYETPATLGDGLLSGLAHPVIGLDHLVFIVAAGLLALLTPYRFLLPSVFILAGMAGVAAHASVEVEGLLSTAEIGVSVSLVAVGILLLWGKDLSLGVLASLFVLAGLCHGYAFGTAVIGAEPAPMAAYLAGLVLVQLAMALGIQEVVRFGGALPAGGSRWFRGGGGVAMGAGVVFLSQSLPL